jgi:hypothetical protein
MRARVMPQGSTSPRYQLLRNAFRFTAGTPGSLLKRHRLGHKRFQRNAKPIVQPTDHAQRKWTRAVEHLRDTRTRANDRLEILASEASLLHAKANRCNRCRRSVIEVLTLVCVYERGKHIELVPLRRSGLRLTDFVDALERSCVVSIVADGSNGHDYTFAASIFSYSACVPMNRM